jgi:hypothetical protein
MIELAWSSDARTMTGNTDVLGEKPVPAPLRLPVTLMTIPGGKGGRCVGLTALPPSCADCLEILGASTSWSLKGLSRPVEE